MWVDVTRTVYRWVVIHGPGTAVEPVQVGGDGPGTAVEPVQVGGDGPGTAVEPVQVGGDTWTRYSCRACTGGW